MEALKRPLYFLSIIITRNLSKGVTMILSKSTDLSCKLSGFSISQFLLFNYKPDVNKVHFIPYGAVRNLVEPVEVIKQVKFRALSTEQSEATLSLSDAALFHFEVASSHPFILSQLNCICCALRVDLSLDHIHGHDNSGHMAILAIFGIWATMA